MPEPLSDELKAILDGEPTDPEVTATLARRYFDYREPLEAARDWNRGGGAVGFERAKQLAAALARKYSHAPRVWYELAFALVKLGQRALTVELLERKVSPDFGGQLDTDTFSLWGRCHKDLGDRYAAAGDYAAAEREYAAAEARYEQAYKASNGDYFPGINVATVRLLRAVVLRQLLDGTDPDAQDRDEVARSGARIAALLDASRQRAAEVLASRRTWQEKAPDDVIWLAATEAEAHVLLGNWALAKQFYGAALRPNQVDARNRPVNPQPHHFGSPFAQLERLSAALAVLRPSPAPPPPFVDFRQRADFFERLAKDAGVNWTAPTPETPK